MRYEQITIQTEHREAEPACLTAYLLDEADRNPYFQTRPAVIICPGGGYEYVSEREGEPVAMRFLAAGFHAFVLHYSVAPARFPVALTELAEAVRIVRENAAQWKAADDQVYVLGFSAGGHLCASLGTLWNHPVLDNELGNASAKERCKPDGMLLCYPVLTMGAYTHKGSRNNLLGDEPSEGMLRMLSLETQVCKDTPPAFLWHTEDDGAVPVENSLQFAAAMRKAGVPFEMHIYQSGVHGLSLCDATSAGGVEHLVPDNAGWMDLAIRWIRRQRGR